MKTTIEIQDDLLERSKRLARQEGTTLRARSAEAPPALLSESLCR